MKQHSDKERLASELAGLPCLDREALVGQWRQLFGTAPPVKVRDNFLIRAIASRLQEQMLGGLKSATKRFLEKAAAGNTAKKQPMTPARSIRPGTQLLREWHGTTYEVIVQENGVLMNGKHYRSLSEAAKAITGAKWSGPLFFGLRT